MTEDLTFPKGFLWGAATASYQIEGAHDVDGRLPSIWDTFSHTPGKTLDGDTGDTACDHYHRVDEDLAIMQRLGLQAYRFSVAWPRVLPTGSGAVNQKGLDFYSRLVDGLLGAGIRPVVTLYHWDLPQALEDRGGWQNRAIADWFTEYAATVTGALGDRVQHWTTLNEPWCSSILSYCLGAHAPGHTSKEEGLVAAHHLMLAHGRSVPVIREHSPGAEVSITLNPTLVIGPDDADERDTDAVRRADNALNRIFYGPIFHAEYPLGFFEDTAGVTDHGYLHDGDLAEISAPLDNLGVNNYFPTRVRAARDGEQGTSGMPGCEPVIEGPPQGPLTAMGWEQSPESHRDVLLHAAKESGLPIYVTENGSAWDDAVVDGAVPDPERVAYLEGHVAAVREAIDRGVDVRGYFAWSLLDNFEWAYGYSKRFGLVRVDYDTQQRTIKDSGHRYARIIAENGL